MTTTEVSEIITQLSNNPVVSSAVQVLGNAVVAAIFLRNRTATEEFEKLKAGKLQEVVNDLLASHDMSLTEYYKTKNFSQIVQKADAIYQNKPHPEKVENYDFDWLIRFYEAVGNISNEKMQEIWARILAGEVSRERSYSLRCIELLKNLSSNEAKLFEKICSHCVCTGTRLYLPHYDKYLEKTGIKFSEILNLDELGLISCNSLLILDQPISTKPQILFLNNDLAIIVSAKNEKMRKMQIYQYPLTGVGCELAAVIGEMSSDEDFIFFAKELQKEFSTSIDIRVHRIENSDEDGLSFYEEDLLEDTAADNKNPS